MKTRPCLLLLLLMCPAVLTAQQKTGSPLQDLPDNIVVLTHFGERADFSPDNQSVAFMAKSFGDAFTIDLRSRAIRCLTCGVPGAAFLRVMHLSTGDYLLIGAERFTDIRTSRGRDNELWLLSKTRGAKPVRLNQKMSEGAAISKGSLLIAFSETSGQNPDLPQGASRLVVAEVDLAGPTLKAKRTVLESPDNRCTLEAQDFFDRDTKLTYTCYEPEGRASVWAIDLKTGQSTNHQPRESVRTAAVPSRPLRGDRAALPASMTGEAARVGERGRGVRDVKDARQMHACISAVLAEQGSLRTQVVHSESAPLTHPQGRRRRMAHATSCANR